MSDWRATNGHGVDAELLLKRQRHPEYDFTAWPANLALGNRRGLTLRGKATSSISHSPIQAAGLQRLNAVPVNDPAVTVMSLRRPATIAIMLGSSRGQGARTLGKYERAEISDRHRRPVSAHHLVMLRRPPLALTASCRSWSPSHLGCGLDGIGGRSWPMFWATPSAPGALLHGPVSGALAVRLVVEMGDAGLVGDDYGLYPVACVQFVEDVADVGLDGVVTDDEGFGDLAVG